MLPHIYLTVSGYAFGSTTFRDQFCIRDMTGMTWQRISGYINGFIATKTKNSYETIFKQKCNSSNNSSKLILPGIDRFRIITYTQIN